MFDGIRLTFTDPGFLNKMENNNSFDIERSIDTNSEIKSYNTQYKGLTITIHPRGYTVIKGSLHKYYNNGEHNYNDFTFECLQEAINRLKTELGLNPELAHISNLEFGINIETAFNPNNLLDNLIRFKDKQFNAMKVNGNGNGRTCSFKQYEIKIYNKGLQYRLKSNLLRIEKKIIRMCALNYKKLYLSDLLDIALWKHCKTELLRLLGNITINEPIADDLLNNVQLNIYNTLPNNAKWSTYNKNKKCRYKKAFNKLIAIYGKEKYRAQLVSLVNAKCQELAR